VSRPTMSRIGRAAAAVTGAVVVAAAASACTTSPGAAAVVGSHRIATQTLQRAVDVALANPTAQQQLGSDRGTFVRTELSRLINNILIAHAAAQLKVTATNADVDAELTSLNQQAQANGQQLVQAAAASGVPERDLRTFVRFFVLQQKIAAKLAERIPVSQDQLQAEYQKDIDQFDQVHSAHILVKDKKTADRLLAQVRKDPGSFAALAAHFSIDTGSKNNGGDLGFAGHGQFVKQFTDAIFAAKPGSFVEAHSKFGWHVIHVIAHRKVTFEQATPQLKATILKNERDRLLQKALTDQANKLGVHVNPRYGRWDPVTTQVVATSPKNDVSSPTPSSGSG
jgi:parvulin-like peptidyl-prolyl isomerase